MPGPKGFAPSSFFLSAADKIRCAIKAMMMSQIKSMNPKARMIGIRSKTSPEGNFLVLYNTASITPARPEITMFVNMSPVHIQ